MGYLDRFNLTGSVAVITGGASGIGREAANALSECGATIVLLDRDAAQLEAGREKLTAASGRDAHVHTLDVTDSRAVEATAAEVLRAHRQVDILVNSAGIARRHSALDVSDDDWRLVMDINVNGMFWVCRAFGRAMVERRQGSIINLGSMSGTIVNRPQHAASYMASKGAVHMLTKALAVEWADYGVRVNALAPGYVATEMTLKMRERPELFNAWMEMTPMGRCGEPEEIAAAILYLASPASGFVTGAILPIDGGYTAW